MILTNVGVRNAIMLVVAGMVLAVAPNADAQQAANDVWTVDGGGLPTPEEIASHVRTVPTPNAIIGRILSANEDSPHIASMEFVANLRVRRALSAPPNCVFEGTVKFQAGHRSAAVNHLTPGLLCFALNRTIISKLFEGVEPFATLLARFDFQVLGVKIVNGRRYYLMQGKTRKSTDDPKAMIGWIDYGRGLVIDATMQYAAGAIDLAQNYTTVNDAWLVTYQYINIPSLGSTVEISYGKITLASHAALTTPCRPFTHSARRGSPCGSARPNASSSQSHI
ncbi:MAG: hypothetical protein ACYDAB_05155 [bacterium]